MTEISNGQDILSSRGSKSSIGRIFKTFLNKCFGKCVQAIPSRLTYAVLTFLVKQYIQFDVFVENSIHIFAKGYGVINFQTIRVFSEVNVKTLRKTVLLLRLPKQHHFT